MDAPTMACMYVTDREPTEVAHELATSLAPAESVRFSTKVVPGLRCELPTNVPSIQKGKYGAYGKEVVILTELHLDKDVTGRSHAKFERDGSKNGPSEEHYFVCRRCYGCLWDETKCMR